ncbi:hypothetical protein [Trichloromonas sp.]|uniref:hypothetical protein n=1 Tax=Trichloromonas sp. TaxID=3069249 RepID=UPI002A37FF53|nr:hypothetical protein [Trichloromonas sp.]
MVDIRWRLLRTDALPGALNMALDEVLRHEVAVGRLLPQLRLYRWQWETVSLGYFHRDEVIDRAYWDWSWRGSRMER